MDRKIWSIVTATATKVNRKIPRQGRRSKFSDITIVRMYFWTAGHDRTLQWACRRDSYNSIFRPRVLPSRSQFGRRLYTPRVRQLIAAVNRDLLDQRDHEPLAFFDGKPLPVSRNTRDKDAKKGYAVKGFAHGYKLHALTSRDGYILEHSLESMNASEPATALKLTEGVRPGMRVLADANYDSAALYAAVEARGGGLLTPLRGSSTNRQVLARMPQARRKVLEKWSDDPECCQQELKARDGVERVFSALTSFAGGLSPLPNWVRRLLRVRRWVMAKIILYHARLNLKKMASTTS